jgi:hypothetical protein
MVTAVRKAWYDKRLTAGLCPYCGGQNADKRFKLCLSCREKTRLISRSRYKANLTYERLRNRNKRRHIKSVVLGHYSKGTPHCVCRGTNCWHTGACSVSDIRVLELDHINGGGNIERKRVFGDKHAASYQWIINNDFPVGYQTLCSNCNRFKTNPHQ